MQDKSVSVQISKNEAWKLLDAIKSYQKDYALTGPTNKIFDCLVKKLTKVTSGD
jgi:hypothetical protein